MANFLKILGCSALILTFIMIVFADDDTPGTPTNKWAAELYIYWKVVHMTKIICRDATVKLRHATRISKKYQRMLSYELGNIAAGIQEKFKHMLEVYRKYSNLTEYRSNEYSVKDVFNAYHIVKGDFNEIRMASNMYYEIVEKHRKKRDREKVIKDRLRDILASIGKEKKKKHRRSGVIDEKASWVPYNNSTMKMKEKDLEDEYKRSLRYKKWSEKWDNFIPEVEGVDIDEAAIPKI